jgi:hypothetical protein
MIKFVKNEVTNTVTLTQKGLIQKIIKATGLQDCNPNHTPALQACLGIDPDGEPMDEFWNYRSIVGMLLYLSTNTRPDIAFAVSQVARFNHSPKKSHASAIKTIVCYLHRTADKGTIVTPTGDLSLIVTSMLTLPDSTVVTPITLTPAPSPTPATSSPLEDVQFSGSLNSKLRFPCPHWNLSTLPSVQA